MTAWVFSFWFLLIAASRVFAVPQIPELKSPPVVDDNEASPAKALKESSKNAFGVVGGDLRRFGEEVAKRIDGVVKKNDFMLWGDPWTLQGIPLIFPSAQSGFHLGLRLQLQNIRRQDPHLVELVGQILSSDYGRSKHILQFDYPHALDGKFRFRTSAVYDRDISLGYFGIGNGTSVDTTQLPPGSDIYGNTRSSPGVTLELLRYFGRHWRAGPIVGFKWMNITAPPASLLNAERPVGFNGGRTHYWGLAFIHDTLDFEPYPSRGKVHEFYFYLYNGTTGSDYDFYRGTYTYRRFIPLHRRLIFAHRTLFEVLHGSVPFYELGFVGGSNTEIAIGGDRFFRGYQGNRFLDKVRLVAGFELRWDPLFFTFARQDITAGLVPFFDVGRVWPDVGSILTEFSNFHPSIGWGVRLIWNSRLILRGDFAFTPDGYGFIINLGNNF